MTKLYGSCLLTLFLLSGQPAGGQSKLNFGISSRQPESEWPKSKAPVPTSVRKAYQYIPGQLKESEDGNLILAKGWEMIEGHKLNRKDLSLWDTRLNTSEWYNAIVPGTVLTTLVDQQMYPDPYYSLNNLLIPDTLCRMDWWYRISFETPSDKDAQEYHLLLNGINYKAEIWLNGERIGTMQGAFKRGYFPISGLLKKDSPNTLAIHILPPNNPGIPFEENKSWFGPNGGALCLDGPTFISSEGWDWIPGIRDRNIGIWQDVRLIKTGKVQMKDPYIITDLPLPDTTSADISIQTLLVNTEKKPNQVVLKGQIGKISFEKEITLSAGEQKKIVFSPEIYKQLHLQYPALWWPNGYGEQPLHTLDLTLEQNGKVIQTNRIRFGIREMSYELMAQTEEKKNIRFRYSPTDVAPKAYPLFDYKKVAELKNAEFSGIVLPTLTSGATDHLTPTTEGTDNPYLTICVNGRKIFCKGGNWGMDDGMKRVTRDRLEPYFRLHKEEHFNMVRNWTGESTEELFYSLCDEYGLLLWNDFSISTQDYNLEPLDNALFLDNVQDIVRRFRNHPSIALWCPRNEGYAPERLEDGFQQIIHTEDGTRHYHGNSRSLNLMSSGPWHYIENQLQYLNKMADGFSTELGSPSVPTAATIRKFIHEADLWPIGDVWYYHDLHYESFDWKHYIRDVHKLGKQPCQDVDEFCARAQFINYNTYRNMFEAWNQRMWNNTSGLLLWMSHPAWPSLIWQTYSFDYETHGAFYGSKKACEPLHIQWNYLNRKLQVINTTLKDLPGAKAVFTVYSNQGERLHSNSAKVDVRANSATDCFEAAIPQEITALSLVRLHLFDRKGRLISENDYWINPSDYTDYSSFGDIGKATVQVHKTGSDIQSGSVFMRAEIKNTSQVIALGVKLNARDAVTNEILLPAYASDGYFNLLPGEKKSVSVEVPVGKADTKVYLSVEGLNMN